jgi:hypothetical protein
MIKQTIKITELQELLKEVQIEWKFKAGVDVSNVIDDLYFKICNKLNIHYKRI